MRTSASRLKYRSSSHAHCSRDQAFMYFHNIQCQRAQCVLPRSREAEKRDGGSWCSFIASPSINSQFTPEDQVRRFEDLSAEQTGSPGRCIQTVRSRGRNAGDELPGGAAQRAAVRGLLGTLRAARIRMARHSTAARCSAPSRAVAFGHPCLRRPAAVGLVLSLHGAVRGTVRGVRACGGGGARASFWPLSAAAAGCKGRCAHAVARSGGTAHVY